nr:MAG TPA: hypothetical protein [Crassvirales sp.]
MYIIIILGIIILGIVYLIKRLSEYIKYQNEILKSKLFTLKSLKTELYSTSNLINMYDIHKRIFIHFNDYYIPSCINVSKYGYFRASSWEDLNPDNILLGNIFGFNTLPLSYWNKCNDLEATNRIKNQYKTLLINGLNSIESKIFKDLRI